MCWCNPKVRTISCGTNCNPVNEIQRLKEEMANKDEIIGDLLDELFYETNNHDDDVNDFNDKMYNPKGE